MPIEHINKTDTLNEGRVKLNAAIDGANAADVTSKAADTKATQALANSESTQTQLDTIVIDGDSSVEAAQARVDEKGVPHPTLKARIDDGMNSVNQQLADIVVNVMYPPLPLNPLSLDGITDETDSFQNILDYVGDQGGGKVLIPQGTLIHTINFIPNNVIIEGVKGKTIIKLKDSFNPTFEVRKQAGIYPKKNIDFFGVRNIVYDGNYSQNIQTTTSPSDFNNYFAHGICNGFTDVEVDPYDTANEG